MAEHKGSPAGKAIAFCLVAAVVVALDQASKALMRVALADGARHALIPGVMDLLLVQNTGAAFSMGEGMGWVFIALAAVVCVAALAYVIRERPSWPLTIVLGCIAGGGIGNMVDRIVAGSVTDFLATSFISFPVFNVADIFVTCGVFLALILLFREEPAET